MTENATEARETADASSCCSSTAQETCCEPAAKSACCASKASDGSCGCVEGTQPPAEASAAEIREAVRERYAQAAASASCCGPDQVDPTVLEQHERDVFGTSQYPDQDRTELSDGWRAPIHARTSSGRSADRG